MRTSKFSGTISETVTEVRENPNERKCSKCHGFLPETVNSTITTTRDIQGKITIHTVENRIIYPCKRRHNLAGLLEILNDSSSCHIAKPGSRVTPRRQ
jgi:hypothetical protein